MTYIERTKPEACIFCMAAAQPNGPENLIVMRGRFAFVILNRFPYTSGHLMVVPFEHRATLAGLTPEIRAEMMELTTKATDVLGTIYRPQGFNLGINMGEVAGAGIVDHIHLHVVPRWGGDTNFMSTLGETRVLPETLDTTYTRVREAWESFG
jgi:ATP adenylyltransferase